MFSPFSRAVLAYSRLVTRSFGRFLGGEANAHTEKIESPAVPRPKGTLRGYMVLAALLGFVGYKVTDLTVNDDWDTRFMDNFRVPRTAASQQNRPKVVVLGTGWSSMSFLRKLHTDEFNVTVVSPRNYFLFTPLLPSTTSGSLKFDTITTPIYEFASSLLWGRCKFIQMSATKIDTANKRVYCEDLAGPYSEVNKAVLDYDYLVVGVGSKPCSFGVAGVEENAHFFKSLKDARSLRSHLLTNFERANYPGHRESEVERLLHVVIVGGGPTGVELASEINDFIRRDLVVPYSSIVSKAKVTIIEALPNLLSMLKPKLVDYAENQLSSNNIQILKNHIVTNVTSSSIKIKDRSQEESTQLDYGVLVWATGNTVASIVSDLINTLGPDYQSNHRGVVVDDHLLVKGTNDVFAFGDNAILDKLPATAQVATQEGNYLARLFNENAEKMNEWAKNTYHSQNPKVDPLGFTLKEKAKMSEESHLSISDYPWSKYKPFKYNYLGTITSVGKWDTLLDNGDRIQITGKLAFLISRTAYWIKYASSRNRIRLTTDYIISDIFGGSNSNFN